MNTPTIGALSVTLVPESSDAAAAAALYRKVSWRIVPFLMLCYMVAFLDRINVGFAQLQMKQTMPFGDVIYGLGAGIFFAGYFLFEVPSNLALTKIGFRRTLIRIMSAWGVVASGMAFVHTPTQFLVARFLLGAFEAGFFPGVILYLTYWYPSARRGQMIALFMVANALGSIMAGPLSGGILKFLNGAAGLHGWQWLFILEGLPACLCGAAAFFLLSDGPGQAKWLNQDERSFIERQLAADEQGPSSARHAGLRELLRDPKVYALSAAYLFQLVSMYTMVFLTPTLIHRWGVSDLFIVGLCASLPHTCGMIGAILLGRSSDRRHERRGHYMVAVLGAAFGVVLIASMGGDLVPSLLGLCLAATGWIAAMPLFFAAVTDYLPKASAAAGIALISSLGNLGAAIGPALNAWLDSASGSILPGQLMVIGSWLVAAAIMFLALRATRAAPADA
jgi:MFS family permease